MCIETKWREDEKKNWTINKVYRVDPRLDAAICVKVHWLAKDAPVSYVQVIHSNMPWVAFHNTEKCSIFKFEAKFLIKFEEKKFFQIKKLKNKNENEEKFQIKSSSKKNQLMSTISNKLV